MSGADSSGYLNAARRLVDGKLVERVGALDKFGLPDEMAPSFIPLGFVFGPGPDQMAPFYPVGFPLHLAAAALLGGWERAPFWIPSIAGAFCILVFYLLAREFSLPPSWSIAGSAILAVWPVFLAEATEPLSDGVATLWSSASLLFALRAGRKPAWACASGAAFGMAVLVRPTNVLLLLPLLFALPLRVGTVGLFFAGGLPFGAVFAWYGRTCYGHFLRTGYGDFLASFAVRYFPSRSRY